MKKNNKFIIELLITVGIITIMMGTYLLYLSNSKRIFSKAINNIESKTEKILDYENNIENYTIINNLKIKSNTNNLSEYIKKNKENNEYEDIYRILNNINNTEDNLEFTSNKSKKELFINYDSKVNEKEFAKEKYYIKDSTEYYYIKGITKNYINNGRDDYFESLNSSTTEQDNLKYLNKTILNKIKNSLDNKYFTKTKDKNYTKVSLKLDSKNIDEIYSNVLKELKNDKRANSILTGYDKDFFKNNSKINLISKNEEIYINIYTDSILYNPIKYEFIKDKEKIVFECNKPEKLLKIYKNNKLKRTIKISINKNKIKAEIYNKNEKIGLISISKNKDNKKIVVNINEDNKNTDLTITIDKYDKKNNKYKLKTIVRLNHTNNAVELYSLEIDDLLELTEAKSINEDISNADFASSLKDNDKTLMKEKKESIINKFK